MKLSLGNLNPDPYPLYLTCIYTYRVTTTPRVRGGDVVYILTSFYTGNFFFL